MRLAVTLPAAAVLLGILGGCSRKKEAEEPAAPPVSEAPEAAPAPEPEASPAPSPPGQTPSPAKFPANSLPKPRRQPAPASTPPAPPLPPLKLSATAQPDTLEPGAKAWLDVTLGDGGAVPVAAALEIDLGADGSIEARGKGSGRHVLAMPRSGILPVRVHARDEQGRKIEDTAYFRVNAKLRMEFKVRKPRGHMAESLSFRLRLHDGDDSLAQARIRFGEVWEDLPLPGGGKGKVVTLYRNRVFGQPGRHRVAACAVSGDGRGLCDSVQVEIFNAPPVIMAEDTLKARVGQPATLKPRANDPDGRIALWEWDLDADGKFELSRPGPEPVRYTYAKSGLFSPVLRVTTEDGVQAKKARVVRVEP